MSKLEVAKKWREANKERLKKYREDNRERKKVTNRNWHYKNRDRRNAQLRKVYEDRRQWVMDTLGGCCVRCGCIDRRILHVDHVEGGGTAERESGIHSHKLMRHLACGRIPISRFQLLCANCHVIKTFHQEAIPDYEEVCLIV